MCALERERESLSDGKLECKKGQDRSSHGFPLHFMQRHVHVALDEGAKNTHVSETR